jgi:outer membrane receptor for Fe3+-dicitrate
VLSAKDLQASGKQSVRDLLGTLVPSINVSNSGAGASFAVKTISLRGLAGDQVLVLVNGKRRHNTATMFINGTTQNGQSPADLDLIPTNSIARVEVLRDGASAQYGSDAIAGVVNVILKDDLTGAPRCWAAPPGMAAAPRAAPVRQGLRHWRGAPAPVGRNLVAGTHGALRAQSGAVLRAHRPALFLHHRHAGPARGHGEPQCEQGRPARQHGLQPGL